LYQSIYSTLNMSLLFGSGFRSAENIERVKLGSILFNIPDVCMCVS
jgi:hypothetical protein